MVNLSYALFNGGKMLQVPETNLRSLHMRIKTSSLVNGEKFLV